MFELGNPARAEIPAYEVWLNWHLPNLLLSIMESPNFMEMIYLQYSFNQYILWKKKSKFGDNVQLLSWKRVMNMIVFCIFDVKIM